MRCSRGHGAWGMGHGAWALAALVAGLFLVGSPRQATAQRPGPGPRPRLNLTADQRQKLQKHIRETARKIQQTRRDLRDARFELNRQFGQWRLDDRKVHETARRINDLQLRLHNISLENQIGLRRILTREQFDKVRMALPNLGIGEGPGLPPGDGPIRGPGIGRLGLSDDQRQQIRKLWERSRDATDPLLRRFRTDAESLRDLYLNYNLDPKQAKSRIESLSKTQRELLAATHGRQIELRRILTEEQFRTLAQSIRPPGPRPGPGPRRFPRGR